MARKRMKDEELPAYMRALAAARREAADHSSRHLICMAVNDEFLDELAAALGIAVDAEDWWDSVRKDKRAKIFARISMLRGLNACRESSAGSVPSDLSQVG